MTKPIALAADHGGFELKEAVKAHLDELGLEYIDFGTHSTASVDYPDMALPACDAVVSGQCSKALLFCGTGVGISMAANKVKGIRACCCSDSFSCEYTRRHNDANALCMGGRVVGPGLACQLVDIFLNTEFEGGRHEKRIKFIGLIAAPEGIKALHEAHPDVDIYLGAQDDHLNENGYIVPGLGDAGDRIYGTK